GEGKAQDESKSKRQQRLDKPRPQLDQMVHQRRAGGFDIVLTHGVFTVPASGFASGKGAAASDGFTGSLSIGVFTAGAAVDAGKDVAMPVVAIVLSTAELSVEPVAADALTDGAVSGEDAPSPLSS